MSVVEATLAAHQPSRTRNVPSVTDAKPSAKATNSAPTSAVPTPGYITHSRPKRSEAQPSGIVKANMPAAGNEGEIGIAVSEWPWCDSTSEVSTMTIAMLPWPAQFERIASRVGTRRSRSHELTSGPEPAAGFGGGT